MVGMSVKATCNTEHARTEISLDADQAQCVPGKPACWQRWSVLLCLHGRLASAMAVCPTCIQVICPRAACSQISSPEGTGGRGWDESD